MNICRLIFTQVVGFTLFACTSQAMEVQSEKKETDERIFNLIRSADHQALSEQLRSGSIPFNFTFTEQPFCQSPNVSLMQAACMLHGAFPTCEGLPEIIFMCKSY